MCYAGGPYCYNHASKRLENAVSRVKDNPSPANRERLKHAVRSYDSTPKGQKELESDLQDPNLSDKDRTLYQKRLDAGKALYEKQWANQRAIQAENKRFKEQGRKVDVKSINMSGGHTYKKNAVVTVVQAKPGQKLTTTLKDGTVETSRTLDGSEHIITNPSGEQYAVSKETLDAKYDKNPDGTYSAKGQITAVKNPFGRDITITAPWGEEQHGNASCYIAQSSTDENDRYIIGHKEFHETYKQV